MEFDKFSYNPLLSIHRRLAFLLARAAWEVFPDIQIVFLEGTDSVFYADLCFTQPFDKVYLPLIQERFSRILKENLSIEHREMVPASARGVLERAGQKLQIERLPSHSQMLVDLSIQGDFALLFSEIKENSERVFWEILGAFAGGEVHGQSVIRLIGIACEDLSSMKACRKTWTRYPYMPIEQVVAQENFLISCEESYIWLPRGERFRRELQTMWEKMVQAEGFHQVSTGGNFLFELAWPKISLFDGSELRLAEVAYTSEEREEFQREGVLTPKKGWTDRILRICPKERVRETCISSLQFILQIPRMLSFNARIVLYSSRSEESKILRAAANAVDVVYHCEMQGDRRRPCIEVQISDRIGRWWTLSSLWIAKERTMPGQRLVFASCFGKWERLMGLLVEKFKSKQMGQEEMNLEQFIRMRTGSEL